MLTDTHCHLDEAPLREDAKAVLARARAAGVGAVLVPGTDPSRWSSLRVMADEHPEVEIAIGVHPHSLPALGAEAADAACHSLAVQARAACAMAIGECGLDGRVARDAGISLERQAEIVRAHCRAADELGLPLIVHVTDAMGVALALFESLGPRVHGAVLHAFGGPAELVPRWAALGFSFGIGPSITWSRARRPKEAACSVPIDRILLETDGPDTYVEGAPGRVGEPAQVRDVLRALARLRGQEEHELEVQIGENVARTLGRRLEHEA